MSLPFKTTRPFRGTGTEELTTSIVGIGGAGTNMVNNLKRSGMTAARLIATNTDAASLKAAKLDYKFLVGEDFLGGRSAVSVENGTKAMEDGYERLLGALSETELIILLSGLGGGAGTGGHTVLAERLKERFTDSMLISAVTLPFSTEGEKRVKNAQQALPSIIDSSDVALVNFSDVLKEKHLSMPLLRAYKMMDNRMAGIVLGIVGLQALDPLPGLPNVDFAMFKSLARDSGLGHIGIAEGSTLREALERTFADPYGDADITGARGAAAYVEGSHPRISVAGLSGLQKRLTEDYRISEAYFGLKPSWEFARPKVVLFALGVKSNMVDDYIGLKKR